MVFVALVALAVLLGVTRWFQRKERLVGRVSVPPNMFAPAPPDETAVLVGPAVVAKRSMDDARADHLAALKARVAYFAGGTHRVRCERDPDSGLFRAWADASSYEKAALRATWRTEAGAWRLLLRTLLGPEFGGIWLAVVKS